MHKYCSKKIILTILIIACMLFIQNKVFAFNPDKYNPGTLKYSDAEDLFEKAVPVIKIISDAGIIISVIAISIIGLKYMFGSPLEERVKIKEMMFPLICGCIMIGGTSSILRIIASIANW